MPSFASEFNEDLFRECRLIIAQQSSGGTLVAHEDDIGSDLYCARRLKWMQATSDVRQLMRLVASPYQTWQLADVWKSQNVQYFVLALFWFFSKPVAREFSLSPMKTFRF